MEKAKSFTQSITMILVVVLTMICTFLTAKAMQLSGLLQGVDNLYPVHSAWFWAAFVATRLVYAVANSFGLYCLITWLREHSWLWFKPSRTGYSSATDNKDQSGFYVFLVILLLAAIEVSELLIRVFTGTDVPFG